MTTSKIKNASEAFVWVWLPGEPNPVVAGRIKKVNGLHIFTYGRSYLENKNHIPLSPVELPLQSGDTYPEGINTIHTCLRDGAPDAWGRRVIEYRYPHLNPGELDYMLLSNSDRIGALDFQASSLQYTARESKAATLDELLEVATCVEQNKPLPKELEYALLRGTSVGGARPKALIQDNQKSFIAKFALTTDTFNIIKTEYIGMRLAKLAGIQTASVTLKKVLGKDVLLIERFDRIPTHSGASRCFMLSALSLFKLNELEARYASYSDLAEIIRQKFANPKNDLVELYKRLVFNILIGNTDDHARNHSAFWDGKAVSLTPAYDLCPQMRVGQEATQAMAIEGIEGNFSTLVNVLSISKNFQISSAEASQIIYQLIDSIENHWLSVCEEAEFSAIERNRLWKNIIFNPFGFINWKS